MKSSGRHFDEKDRFGDKLRQAGKAREDQWAAQRDRDLLAALRRGRPEMQTAEMHRRPNIMQPGEETMLNIETPDVNTNVRLVKNGLSPLVRRETIDLLNRRLADSLDLMLQAKQAHWTVRGANFLSLHELFDNIAAGMAKNADQIAERVMQLGGMAEGTAQVVARISQLEPYPIALSEAEGHIGQLSSALGNYVGLINQAIDYCTYHADAVSADIFTGISRDAAKWLWMIEAHR